MKKEAVKYNQRIGDLVVKFVDYMQITDEAPTDALEIFSIENALSANEAYQMALLLKGQGYQVDPLVFHPDYIGEENEVTFDEYDHALLRGEHDKAHRMYESMTPAQKQVIRDRRGHMNKKIKTAQQADAEAVIEKNVPTEGVEMIKELPKQESQELAELIEPAKSIISQQQQFPPDSMKIFLPFAHSFDEFKRAREQEVAPGELHKRTAEFLKNFGKVLHYLDQQDYEVTELMNLVKKYADLLYMSPVTAEASRRTLALAAKLQEQGQNELASQLTKTIIAAEVSDIVDQAEKVVNASPLTMFQEALGKEDFDQAREIYLSMSPIDRQTADAISKKHFAVQSIVSLYKIGESLFNKGNTKEADEVSKIVKAQFVELPGEMQQEIILLIVPQDQLPQGFQGGKNRGMEDKLMNMQNRLMPTTEEDIMVTPEIIPPERQLPCGCGCSAKSIIQLLKVADTLDRKGQTEMADQVVAVFEELKKSAQFAKMPNLPTQMPELSPEEIEKVTERIEPPVSGREIGTMKCQECGGDILYDKKKTKPQYCSYCAKILSGSPWVGARIAKKAEEMESERRRQQLQPFREKSVSELRPYQPIADKWTKDYPIDQAKQEFTEIAKAKFTGKQLEKTLREILKANRTERLQSYFYSLIVKKEGDPAIPFKLGSKKIACDDQIEGGLADTKPDDQFDAEEVEKGVKVEMEHTNDEKLAREIAKDHLAESEDYYKKLDIMEHSELKDMEKKEEKKGMKIRSFTKQAQQFENEKEELLVREVNKYLKKKSFETGQSISELANSQIAFDMAKETRLASASQITDILERFFGREGKRQWRKQRQEREQDTGFRERMGSSKKQTKLAEEKDDSDGVPAKVREIADAIRRDKPETSDEEAYRMAWETYCSYINPGHEGCTEKGKSHRESPKPYEKSSSLNVKADEAKDKYVSEEGHFKGKEGSGERWDNCIKYQMSQGKSKESAEKICGYIKSRKG